MDGHSNTDNRILSGTGVPLEDITLEAVLAGKIAPDDIKISAGTLERQSGVSASAGRPQMAENLLRAAEMTKIPDNTLLEIYNKLRPNRATKAELEKIADDLGGLYGAPRCAALVRDALAIYEKRGILL
ncbi:MAG: diol dehydratase small subunit [Firmicutes bacterium]|nr:diol dehydratase small subunit [Bacillota bacterium]